MLITVRYPTPSASFAEQQDTIVSSFEQIDSNVIYIDCSGNGLSSLPENFGDLFPNLIHFDCSQNELSCLPLSLIKCCNLKYINYSENKIDKLPFQMERFIKRINNPRETPNIQFDIKNYFIHRSPDFNKEELIKYIVDDKIFNCKEQLIKYINDDEIHPKFLLTYGELLWNILMKIEKDLPVEEKNAIKRMFNEDMIE